MKINPNTNNTPTIHLDNSLTISIMLSTSPSGYVPDGIKDIGQAKQKVYNIYKYIVHK